MKALRANFAWVGWPLRVAIAVIAALVLLIAANSWSSPPLANLERLVFDLRSMQDTASGPDERIVLIVFTDEMLYSYEKKFPIPRAPLARALANIDDLNPRSISIDIPIDRPQAEDRELIEVMRSLKSPVFLSHPRAPGDDEISMAQREYIDAFVADTQGVVELVRTDINRDIDGTVRNWPSLGEGDYPLLATRAAAVADVKDPLAGYTGPIAFRGADDWEFPPFPILDIALFADADETVLPFLESQIEGRHVIIGTDVIDVDRVAIPSVSRGQLSVSGVQVHAHMLAQALDGQRIIPVPSWINAVAALISLVIGAAIASGLPAKWMRFAGLAAALGAIHALSLAVNSALGTSSNLNVVGWMTALIAGFLLAGWIARAAAWEKGRTAALALHKYLPAEIAESIVTQPDRLGLQGETRDVYVMFTDLEGFTSLCQSVPAANVAEFLNEYLEEISQIVLDHGGTIDKFVGDAVVAFWGAPVAHSDDAERITRAAIEIKRAMDVYKGRDIGGDHLVGRTRIGVHFGSAIVGNFGGEGRMQYTALGDTMNVAARLEGANKELGTSILMSGEAFGQLSGAIPCRIMGQIHVRGRSQPLAIYEPDLDLDVDTLNRLNRHAASALGGDAEALAELESWVRANPEDRSTAGLVARIKAAA